MAKKENEYSLKRDVGWYGSFCMGYADVGADIYVAIGLVAFYAAGAMPLALAIASITYICTGLAYAELATTYPYAGGAHVYAMKAFNDLAGFIAGWAVMLDYTVDIALFALATSGYLSFFLPWLKTGSVAIGSIQLPYLGVTSLILIAILLAINVIGIRESSALNEGLVSLDLIVEAAIILLGLFLAFNFQRLLSQVGTLGVPSELPNISYFYSQDLQTQNFVYGITLAMCSFIGIESIAQAAEETKRPDRWVPRAHKLSILSVIIFALGLSVVSMGMIPWQSLAAASDPIAVIAGAIPVIGGYFAPIVAITGMSICYVSTNTGVIGVSRIVFSMGRYKLLPKWFYKVHPKFRTPYRTILLFGVIGGLLAFSGELHLIADLYNFGALLSYIIVNICLIVLRNTEPEAYRAWKIPGSLQLKIGQRNLIIPLISVVGVATCTIIWLLILTYHPVGRLLGTVWVVIGIVGFYFYRHYLKTPMLSRETGKGILPGGYRMNALVLTRTPESEDAVVSSIKEALDPRFKVTLFTVVDPVELNLTLEDVGNYEQIKRYEEAALADLNSIARKLQKAGFEAEARTKVGSLEGILEAEAESKDNDLIVIIKRKTIRGDLEKRRIDSAYAVASRFPGKVMVVRRVE